MGDDFEIGGAELRYFISIIYMSIRLVAFMHTCCQERLFAFGIGSENPEWFYTS